MMKIPSVTLDEFIKIFSDLISRAAEKMELYMLPSVYLSGPPGIGKSAVIAEMGTAIEANTGKKVKVTTVSLSMFSPVDLRGVPVVSKSGETTRWMIPEVFHLSGASDTINILFFDELPNATPEIQKAAYGIILDKMIGEHALPNNTVCFAAGNRVIDDPSTHVMPKALANRFSHWAISVSYDAWRRWAEDTSFNYQILQYLDFSNDSLFFKGEEDEEQDHGWNDDVNLAYPTPRSWEFVSIFARYMEDIHSPTGVKIVASCVGMEEALAFKRFSEIKESIPSPVKIRRGECRDVPSSQDALNLLVEQLESYFKKGNGAYEELRNTLLYLKLLPVEYLNSFLLDLYSNEDLRRTLNRITDPDVRLILKRIATMMPDSLKGA